MTGKVAVMQEIIKPMVALYGDVPTAWVDQYIKVLQGFDQVIMQKAWEEVVGSRLHRTRPTVGEIRQACEGLVRSKPVVSANIGNEALLWEDRDYKIKQMVEGYIVKWLKYDGIASSAVQEGWIRNLEKVARNIAFIQAQIICGSHGFGYSSDLPVGKYDMKTLKNYARQVAMYAKSLNSPSVELSFEEINNIKGM